ncbi:MAG: putative DNA binding domain-containing protein, partial [Candidatus Rokubacteria bacterium]|nr:putative DNA binding domain-containing protein [Candidatus Rokubacteria bacterium]
MTITERQVDEWLRGKENEHLEFKEAKSNFHFEKLVKYCAALANEGGGSIVLGVTDKPPRMVVGTSAFQEIERTKAGLVERLRLRISADEVQHRQGRVLIFTAPARPIGTPIPVDGAYWMRVGEDLVPMTPDQLRRIFDEAGPDFSAEACPGATVADLDPRAIEALRHRWHVKTKRDAILHCSDEQLLRDTELVSDAGVTYAALVLLGTRQALGRFLAQAEVVFEYRSSEAPGPASQREEFREGFLLFYDRLWELINLRNDRQHYQDGLFMLEIPTFNEGAVREVILNAVAHRDYRLAGSVQTLQLPATAQAILAARIDRLTPEDKQLLQAAAVVGKDVPFALLEAIAEQPEDRLRAALARLQATEFLYEARLFPELEYTFKHALTHEVAYAGLLQDRRRTLHARILEAMEQLYTDRLDEHVERLAHHASRGDVHEKAAHYLRRAGNKAAARSALRDARACYEQALAVLEALPANQSTLEQGFEIRLELRTVLTQLAELRPALERLREAETLSERLNDDHRRARVCSILMTLHTLLGELDEAVATGTRALEMAGRLGDLRLRILTTSYLEQAQYYRGEYERVVELATDALAVLPADWVYEHFGMVAPASVYARSWLVISLAELGRFAEAAEHAAEAIRLAEPAHHAYTIGLAHRAAGTFHLLAGDWARARSLLEHGITVLRTGNVSLSLPHTLVGSAWALAQLGATSDALNRLRDGEQALADHATAGMRRAWDDYVVGRTWLLLGRLDEARAAGERAVELLPSQPAGAAHALHLLGDVATHPDRFDAER